LRGREYVKWIREKGNKKKGLARKRDGIREGGNIGKGLEKK
jgi:hypothetical protein